MPNSERCLVVTLSMVMHAFKQRVIFFDTQVLNDPDEAIKAVKVFCKSNCNSSIFVETHQIIEGILKVLPECIYLYGKLFFVCCIFLCMSVCICV